MKTHMELHLRDGGGRKVLVKVEHDSSKPTDYTAITYVVIALGVNYSGRERLAAAEYIEQVTQYKLAPMMTALGNMVDALLDLSCNKVTGSGERVNA